MYDAMIVISIGVLALVTAYYVRHRACSIYHPVTMYLAFHALVFVFRPIMSRIYDYRVIYNAVGFQPSEWDKITVLLGTNLALIVFVAVALRVGGQPMVFRQEPAEVARRSYWMRLVWLVAIPIGLLAAYSLITQWLLESSSIRINKMDMRTGIQTMDAMSGYLVIVGSMLTPISVIFAYLNRFKLWSLLPFVAFAILRLGTGGRGDFISGLLMLGALFLFDQRRKWPTPRTMMVAAVAAVLFVGVVQDRGAAIRELFGIEGINEARVGWGTHYKPFEHSDTAMLEAFQYVVYVVPQRSGSYDYFANNLRIITEPIPRALWPEKPYGSPVSFFNLYDYGTPIAMVLSMPGIGWYSLGYLGVAIWSALFAWFFGACYRSFAAGNQSNFATMSYAIVLGVAPLAFRDGLLLTILKLMFAYYLPLLLLLALVMIFYPQVLKRVSRMARSERAAPALQPRSQRQATRSVVPRAWRKERAGLGT